jgi:hypothetical protein
MSAGGRDRAAGLTEERMEDQDYTPHDAFGLLRSYIAHRAHLAEAVGFVRAELERRVTVHDLSKLKDDEFAGFLPPRSKCFTTSRLGTGATTSTGSVRQFGS